MVINFALHLNLFAFYSSYSGVVVVSVAVVFLFFVFRMSCECAGVLVRFMPLQSNSTFMLFSLSRWYFDGFFFYGIHEIELGF